jgi:hypothetical protein
MNTRVHDCSTPATLSLWVCLLSVLYFCVSAEVKRLWLWLRPRKNWGTFLIVLKSIVEFELRLYSVYYLPFPPLLVGSFALIPLSMPMNLNEERSRAEAKLVFSSCHIYMIQHLKSCFFWFLNCMLSQSRLVVAV